MIVAHRGASRDAPANTLRAFELAWKQGADAIEGDFHLTKDGHIVCIHDESTERVSRSNLIIRDSTLAELRKVSVGEREGTPLKFEHIPTLSEVLATVPERKKIYIEIKCGTEIIPELLRGMDTSSLSNDQILIISFNANVLQELKSVAPQYSVSWLCGFQNPESGTVTPSLEQVIKTLTWIQADGLSSNTAISSSVVHAVRKLGLDWHVWTVNEPVTALRMKELGVRSITTDIPGLMREYIL